MRAAVYQRHLATMGGGERFAGMLAAVLVQESDSVDLIGHGKIDLNVLQEHLGIDLTGVTLRLVPDNGEEDLADLSSEYDLFVNASYMSRIRSQAAHSSYVVHFPTPWDHDMTSVQKWLSRTLGPHLRGIGTTFEFGRGWSTPEKSRRRSWSWTMGSAEILLRSGHEREIMLQLGRPAAPGPVTLTVTQDGEALTKVVVRPNTFITHRFTVPESRRAVRLKFESDTFEPGGRDLRSLGVAVSRIYVGGSRLRVRERVMYQFPYLRRDPDDLSFLKTYDQVVSNSEYTRGWVQRYWGRDSELLFPPVHTTAIAPGEKKNQVLSVGRFFGRGRGHSKKQLEMVQAFVAAQKRGELQGWEYHLVGGCSDHEMAYLDEVRAAGAGHAVFVHPNAPRPLVSELFATSKLFWHATGLNEDPNARPWVFEHFGITTVEAMAAGCVPVVIDMAGQKETVRPGVDGYLFSTLQELQDHSAALAGDEELRCKMSAAAVDRAATFSEHAFEDRWRHLIHTLVADAG
jgi:glycosyltransferase involved in cell wall biosynthesis